MTKVPMTNDELITVAALIAVKILSMDIAICRKDKSAEKIAETAMTLGIQIAGQLDREQIANLITYPNPPDEAA